MVVVGCDCDCDLTCDCVYPTSVASSDFAFGSLQFVASASGAPNRGCRAKAANLLTFPVFSKHLQLAQGLGLGPGAGGYAFVLTNLFSSGIYFRTSSGDRRIKNIMPGKWCLQ